MLALVICVAAMTVLSAINIFIGGVDADESYSALVDKLEDENKNEGLKLVIEKIRTDEFRELFDQFVDIVREGQTGMKIVSFVPTLLLLAGYLMTYADAARRDRPDMSGTGFATLAVIMIIKLVVSVLTAAFAVILCGVVSSGVDKIIEKYSGSDEELIRVISSVKGIAVAAVIIFAVVFFVPVIIYQVKLLKFFGNLKKITSGRQIELGVPSFVIVLNYIYTALASFSAVSNLTSGTAAGIVSGLTSAASAASIVLLSLIMQDLKNNMPTVLY